MRVLSSEHEYKMPWPARTDDMVDLMFATRSLGGE